MTVVTINAIEVAPGSGRLGFEDVQHVGRSRRWLRFADAARG